MSQTPEIHSPSAHTDAHTPPSLDEMSDVLVESMRDLIDGFGYAGVRRCLDLLADTPETRP